MSYSFLMRHLTLFERIIFIIFAALSLNVEAVLNCSRQRAKYAHIFNDIDGASATNQTSSLSVTAQLLQTKKASIDATNATSKSPAAPSRPRAFIEPILHECINAYRYDTTQLPLRVGVAPHPLEITYYFFLNNLIALDSTGSLSLKAFLKVRSQNFSHLCACYFGFEKALKLAFCPVSKSLAPVIFFKLTLI